MEAQYVNNVQLTHTPMLSYLLLFAVLVLQDNSPNLAPPLAPLVHLVIKCYF